MDDSNRHLSKEEILEITDNCKGKTFGELGLAFAATLTKGGLGTFVEENVFKYSANNDDNPDFIDAGIELKVTPVKKNQNGTFSSKERLVLNMINYAKEVDKTFETSSFYNKNRILLIWFYLWTKGIDPSKFPITNFNLFEFEKSPYIKTIRRDWEIIHKKIVDGKAHEISESDTTFLAACTKGADSTQSRSQPNSDIEAKPRAYSFKGGFMTMFYRTLIHEQAPYVSFVSEDEWLNNPLEEVYKERLSIYHGKTIKELKRKFNIEKNPKDLCFRIAQGMLGLTGKASSTQEMEDAGIKLKTIRRRKNGTPRESMSFPAFDFSELYSKSWEESDIREDFVDWKLMFVIFQDDEEGVCRFDKIEFWNIPNSLVDGKIKEMYEECVKIVKSGKVIMSVGVDSKGKQKVTDYFPKEKRFGNGVCHVRPHTTNAASMFDLPVPDKLTGWTKYTKQCFWFNKLYIKKILEDIKK